MALKTHISADLQWFLQKSLFDLSNYVQTVSNHDFCKNHCKTAKTKDFKDNRKTKNKKINSQERNKKKKIISKKKKKKKQ